MLIDLESLYTLHTLFLSLVNRVLDGSPGIEGLPPQWVRNPGRYSNCYGIVNYPLTSFHEWFCDQNALEPHKQDLSWDLAMQLVPQLGNWTTEQSVNSFGLFLWLPVIAPAVLMCSDQYSWQRWQRWTWRPPLSFCLTHVDLAFYTWDDSFIRQHLASSSPTAESHSIKWLLKLRRRKPSSNWMSSSA